VNDAVGSQYRASLQMLRQGVVMCSEGLWGAPSYKNSWRVACHALYYTDFFAA